jgi:hypothetical protein
MARRPRRLPSPACKPVSAPPKAITATAHKLACLIYRMLRFGTDYVDRGQDYYERRYRGRVVANFMRRPHELGYSLTKNDNPPRGTVRKAGSYLEERRH